MKLVKFYLLMILLVSAVLANAQSAAPVFNDEDLKKYAITMDSVKDMQETLNESITEMVQKNTVMEVARYNELFKIIDDEAKLGETKATAEEIAFVKQVADKRTSELARITTAYQTMAKEYVGLKAFNAIRKSLATDQALKEKLDTLTKELDSKNG